LLRVYLGDPYTQVTYYCTCAVNFVVFAMGQTLFFGDNIA